MYIDGLLVVIAIVLVFLYQGRRWLEHRLDKTEPHGDHTRWYAFDEIIEVNGVTPRQRNHRVK